jgi:hypothetical protein
MRHVLRRASHSLALGLLALTCTTGLAAAAPTVPTDRVLPIDQYQSEKARRLATTHAGALRDLAAGVYHCMPWVDVQKHSIGFFKPKHVEKDDRYLSIRMYIEQDPSAEFSALPVEERASSMFSRYVGPMLRRMNQNPALLADSSLDGFTVIVEWLKQQPGAGARPVHETLAAFVDKATATAYLKGTIRSRELAARSRVIGFDGETGLGQLRLSAYDDGFVSTYKVKNYELPAGVSCQ